MPNRKSVIIKSAKLYYLISLTHPVGKLKAKFFRQIGFNKTNINTLRKELHNIAQNNNIKTTRTSGDKSGTNYEVRGYLEAPNGKKYPIRTFWYIKTGNKNPSFITAYPV